MECYKSPRILSSETHCVVCNKTDQDVEREQSLIDQWVCLTEERNAVLVPAPGSGIPGAPAEWDPPVGMEKHIPVIFLDLNADDMSVPISGDSEIRVAGSNSILPKEHGSQMFSLPIVQYCDKEVCATAAWDSSIHDSSLLNKATLPNDRIYLILKATIRLSHPATMDLMLRKRLAIHVYKKQSIADKIKKKIQRQDSPEATGVTYEVVSNIPKASEDPENRETLALMAASGEDALTSDGESYIEKYTRGVSAVESILMLDRLRQEVAVKELLAAQGKPLRKTSSVPNISHFMRMEPIPAKLEQQSRADSACELSSHSPTENIEFRKRSSSLKDNCLFKETSVPSTPVGSPFGLGSALGNMTPQSGKSVKPMTTLLEEQSLKDPMGFPHSEQMEENKVRTPSIISSGYDSQVFSTTPASSEDSISIHSASEDFKDLDCGTENHVFNEDYQNLSYNQSEENLLADMHNNNLTPRKSKAFKTKKKQTKQEQDQYEQRQSDGELSSSPKDTTTSLEMKFPSWLTVGECVMISPYNKTGVTAYLGPTDFAPGPWAGIELDTPTGKNDGTVNGVRYFDCKPKFGIFVRPDKLVADSRGRAMRAARNQQQNGNESITKRGRSAKTEGSHNSETPLSKSTTKARSRSRDPKSQMNMALKVKK